MEGERDTYRIVRPVLSAPVPVNPPFNPATTVARDAAGNVLDFVPGGRINFGAGSITFSLPLRVAEGVSVESFVDVTSGISVLGTSVEVPIKDADGETLLTVRGELAESLEGTATGDSASGVFTSVRIQTEERKEDLSEADPDVGTLGVTIDAGLDQFPTGTNVEVTIKKELSDKDRFGVELVAREGEKIVANEAGTVTVETEALESDDISDVVIAIKVSRDWIFQFGATNVRIAHIDSEGNVQLLVPVCTPDADFIEFTCVAESDQGFSEFSLLALADVPADFVAENLVVTPTAVGPGESVKITVDIFNEGARPGVFSSILKMKRPGQDVFDPIAVKEITLLAGASGSVTFFVEREEQGQYRVEIEGRAGEEPLTGTFEVSRPLDAANLSLSNLSITPAQVRPFERVTISVTATNAGELDGRTELEFRINGVLTELRSLIVPGNGSIPVDFVFEPPAEGTYTVEVTDPDEVVAPVRGEITAAVPLEPFNPFFEFREITPLQAQPNEQITFTFDVTNFGEVGDEITAVLLLNGVEISRQEGIFIDTLAIEPVVFTITAPEEVGEYTLAIQDTNLTGTFTVLPVIAEPTVRIRSLDVVPSSLLVGGDVTVSVEIQNTSSELPATGQLVLNVDGVVFEERDVTLAAGEIRTETFTIDRPDVGSHTVEIEGLPATFEVTEERVVERPAILNLVAPLTVSPREVDPGDTVTVSVTIRNEGDLPGATTLIFRVNSVEVDRTDVQVQGQGEVTRQFQVTQDEGGEYAVDVQAVQGVDVKLLEDSFTVRARPEAKLELKRPVTVTPGTVISGEPVTISVLVTNEGNIEGTVPVRLLIDGALIDTQDVTLGAGESTRVVFADVVEPGVGDHAVEVNGLSTQFTVTAAAAAGGFPIIVLIVIVVLVLV